MVKTALVISIIFTLSLSGCSTLDSVSKNRDPDYKSGCVAVEAGLKLGYFNQAGLGEVCKLKCTPTLPKDYCFKYKSRAGCTASVGKCPVE